MPDKQKYVRADFYDIESLSNLFSLANLVTDPNGDDAIEIYYLCRPIGQPYGKDVLLGEPNWQDRLRRRILDRNPNIARLQPNIRIQLFDLSNPVCVDRLAVTFGMSTARYVNDPSAPSAYPASYRIVCDTDKEYDPEKHPYLMGYNSYNYDTTMLAYYLCKAIVPLQGPEGSNLCRFNPEVTPDDMREFNNVLFQPDHIDSMPSAIPYQDNAWIVRKNMLMSGRHLDVARLNEKQRKVGLKRLLGMLGYQIRESENLDTGTDLIRTPEEFYELLAYNVSDIVNLRQLFYHPQYQGQFELKRAMLTKYPELVYLQQPNAYKPDVRCSRVDKTRLNIDSSSAQFATRVLCPYGHIKDIEAVSFLYPAKQKADALGIPQINVLETAKEFFYRSFPGDRFADIRAEFDRVYRYYKNIEGKNFNDSEAYQSDYGSMPGPGPEVPDAPAMVPASLDVAGPGCATIRLPCGAYAGSPTPRQQAVSPVYQAGLPAPRVPLPAMRLSDIENAETCMCYYDANGESTGCFVLFSVGGIHGAEYNKRLFDADMAAFRQFEADMAEVRSIYPDPVDLRRAKAVTLSDGREFKYATFLKSGKSIKDSQYKDPEDLRPILFKKTGKGSAELNKKYVYTSADKANHEDFVSYYPNLLIQMMALYNPGLGYDRYEEIFGLKQEYGKLMKDKSLPDSEREMYRILREGTKLVLNSASGAAAALFENNIRANNQILSMRVIGQLFTWMIGQAQSLEGARIISTNTDGLYSVMEETINNAILERESKNIHVEIEPEPMYLISKDTNNRIELDGDGPSPKILSASGGTLGCHKGPNPSKALAHPAIIDWALRDYLVLTALGPGLDSDFDDDAGRAILERAFTDEEFGRTAKALSMYQNVVASSTGSITYIFGTKDVIPDDVPDESGRVPPKPEPIIMQNYNRVFLIRPDAAPRVLDQSVHLYAATARAIPATVMAKRLKEQASDPDLRTTRVDSVAAKVLAANGASASYPNKDVIVKKVTGIDPEWNVLVDNRDLYMLSDAEVGEIIDSLDMDHYLELLRSSYTDNWKNTVPAVV